MNKELRDGLEIAASYLRIREQALMEVIEKKHYYENKEKRYNDVLRSANGKGKTILGIILLCSSPLSILMGNMYINDFSADDALNKAIAIIMFGMITCAMIIVGLLLILSHKSRVRAVKQKAQRIWDEEVIPAQEALERCVEQAHIKIDPLDEIYQDFTEELVPPSYRTYDDAFALYDLVANGRADSMKEAINLYEVIKREERRMEEFQYAMNRFESVSTDIILQQAMTNIQLSQLRDDIRRNS